VSHRVKLLLNEKQITRRCLSPVLTRLLRRTVSHLAGDANPTNLLPDAADCCPFVPQITRLDVGLDQGEFYSDRDAAADEEILPAITARLLGCAFL
jgi:hypothetical protein